VTHDDEGKVNAPSDADVRLAISRALVEMHEQNQQMVAHAKALTDFVMAINGRVHGTEAVAAVVDENAASAATDRQVAAQKELISYLYEKSQQYVTVVVAGAYAGYFVTLSTVSARFSDGELRLSALLMTISLTIFVVWEVLNVAYIGWQNLRGKFSTESPAWYRRTWPIVIAASLLTAITAVGFSAYSYTSNLISPPAKASNQTSSTSRP
jgi:hypothetical protein